MEIENRKSKIVSSSKEDELTLVELVKVLLDFRLLILAVATGCLIIAIAYAFLSTPIYRAEIIIAPADSSSGGGLSSIVSSFSGLPGFGGLSSIGRRDQVAQAVVTLGSQQFTREFIRENKLLPIFFAAKWDSETGKWDVDSPEDIPTLADGYILFDKKIREIVEEDSGVITLSIEWKNPAEATRWANDLVRRLNDKLRKKAIAEANKTIDYLNKEVEKTRIVELQQAIYFMIENQINLRTMANVREEFAFKVISPAIQPDDNKFVKPNRSLLVLLGISVGLVFGVFISFFIFAIRRLKAELKD